LAIPAPGTINSELHPNDHLLFITSSNEPLPFPGSLTPEGIQHLLHDYPDKSFVDTLVSIALFSVQIGYEESRNYRIEEPNHRSALLQADVIVNSIQSEIDKGRIKEIQLCRAIITSVLLLVSSVK